MDRQDYVIEVSHVSKSFKDNKVLKDVSLLCESGKIYGLVGHNGSGKTVLFKSICGFLSCDEGTITVNGKVMGKDKDMLTDAGIIIEDPGFLRTWSGYHNLEFLYTLRNKKNKDYLCSVLRKVGSCIEASGWKIFTGYASETCSCTGHHGRSGNFDSG